MNRSMFRRRFLLGGVAALAVLAASGTAITFSDNASGEQAAAKPATALPVSVSVVEQRDIALWHEFSGRLEAIERVEVRSRVAGAVKSIHFREGALVKENDLLITIDPEPYAAEVARAEAQVAAAQARVLLTKNEMERGRQLSGTQIISQRDLDQRMNAYREAEANQRAAEAALQSAKLNLEYTQVRAPVSGRVGKLEITVGNLVAAGPNSPMLTTLVSVNPIYASFNADEEVIARAIESLGEDGRGNSEIERIPVEMSTVTSNGTTFKGRLQLIDNQVDARTGTVRVRAVFDNPDGKLIPGQFARLRMGQARTEPALAVSERAIGTDQDKKYVLVVDGDNKAAYREVALGPAIDGLRVVTSGLKSGERIVVNGLQRVRPGAVVEPQMVSMEQRSASRN
ncbi:efflux RND transporter periplasmic adaptor subunit [Pseudorhodoplanes sp.]|jgi:multidrug efflux system membrane fusion protein|uniref:efflux RND transporter periplasmic adaptor subunit n=1 Tax=Pseudorhodoplanes sp. TaxID=1934341 RepID=UPI002C7D8590|nr:efflux RND transporter periplasmic adaptor subunit [Pseudorhodoplanes sp.]HWV42393.1 efflux RND transporter periplasmic adaptor subunit [Pseudorhodoplanes sp.]